MDAFPCSRHPDTETRLRCSACETAICPDCWVEAAVGYQCPGCAGDRGQAVSTRPPRRVGAQRPEAGAMTRRTSDGEVGRAPAGVVLRGAVIGLAAALFGGMLLAPVLQQGTLFLISSAAIGWGVARAVLWGAAEVSTPLTRAMAVTFAGATAAVGLIVAGGGDETGALLLAYPAAVYGGWIVVRRR